MEKYTLNLGLNDKDTKTQKISTLDAYKMIENLIKSLGFEGASIYECTGLYKHESGEYVKETSLRIELLFAEESNVRKLVSILKSVFNQESVAVSVESITSNLW